MFVGEYVTISSAKVARVFSLNIGAALCDSNLLIVQLNAPNYQLIENPYSLPWNQNFNYAGKLDCWQENGFEQDCVIAGGVG